MVTTYGMSDSLGPLALGQRDSGDFLGAQGETRTYSERVAEAIDAEVRALIEAGMLQAEDILIRYGDVLDALATRLLEDETIEGEDLEQVFQSGGDASNGVVTPLPRIRQQRQGSTNLRPLPRVASGLASTLTDGTE